MGKKTKVFTSAIAVMVILYCATLIFNHLNAWVGIAIVVAVTTFIINQFFNNLKS